MIDFAEWFSKIYAWLDVIVPGFIIIFSIILAAAAIRWGTRIASDMKEVVKSPFTFLLVIVIVIILMIVWLIVRNNVIGVV